MGVSLWLVIHPVHLRIPSTPSKSNLNAASGLVPSYFLLDVNLSFYLNGFEISIELQQSLDKNCTKRPQFYPGPGFGHLMTERFSGTLSIKFNI